MPKIDGLRERIQNPIPDELVWRDPPKFSDSRFFQVFAGPIPWRAYEKESDYGPVLHDVLEVGAWTSHQGAMVEGLDPSDISFWIVKRKKLTRTTKPYILVGLITSRGRFNELLGGGFQFFPNTVEVEAFVHQSYTLPDISGKPEWHDVPPGPDEEELGPEGADDYDPPSAIDMHHAFKDLSIKDAMKISKLMDDHHNDRIINIQETMLEIDNILEGFGVEVLSPPEGYAQWSAGGIFYNTIALYSNQGDAYNATIVWDLEEDEFLLTTWADFLEEWEAENLD